MVSSWIAGDTIIRRIPGEEIRQTLLAGREAQEVEAYRFDTHEAEFVICDQPIDISYIRLPQCFVYLAVVLDAYSRRCIGWKLSKTIDTQLALDALERALNSRQVRAGLIHHADRGVQYASSAYVERLLSVGAQISMSGKGNPYDNAKAESFFKTLKYEEVYLKDYRDFQEAEENIGPFIEDVSNQKRLHSSLGYLPPIEFEQLQATTSEILTH